MSEAEPFSPYEARLFAEKYADAKSEKQLGESFWRDFFINVCRVDDLLSAGIEFQYPVKSSASGNINFVDVLWPGILLIEHKTAGKSLEKAEEQARDYLVSLDPSKRSPVFIVSDFAHIRIVDVFAGETVEFALTELPNHLHRIEGILSPYTKGLTRVEITADLHAAELMSNLFVELEKAHYDSHEVGVFLVRTLFLLFGDDTRMWRRGNRGLFEEIVSTADSTTLGASIQQLFQVLNTPTNKRPTTLPASLSDFPYVNGGLFAEQLGIFTFTPAMTKALVKASQYDWSKISPAIFGAMFQTIKDKVARKALGEHYTSEANILKIIGPLFLTEFNDKLHKAWNDPGALKRFHQELGTYNYLDPACGCGNFLLVAYKRLRELELKIIVRLQELAGGATKLSMDGSFGLRVHLAQFSGIEYGEWSSQIANVAMFLADHQANLMMEEITGLAPNRFPLTESAHIVNANALDGDWNKVCSISEQTFIMGNPPFSGARLQNSEQKDDTLRSWGNIDGVSELDYVANWYIVAAHHIVKTNARAGFVSTNSITQGEQPGIIWTVIEPLGVAIDFAHRTFAWSNDAPGQAAVHCVIIGFSKRRKPAKRALWTYETPKSFPVRTLAKNINGYLVDAPNVYIASRSTPLDPRTQRLDFGSMPNDGGFLSDISADEAKEIRAKDPIAAKYLRRIIGAREFIHDEERYCLWLQGADPSDIRTSRVLSERVKAVKKHRQNSKRVATQKLALRSNEFGEIRQPKTDYIVVPFHTSEDRDYVPMGRFGSNVITNNAVGVIADGTLSTFGLLSSRPFNVWNKAISGRIKNDPRISSSITYNNFPFPSLTAAQNKSIEDGAKMVLSARATFPKNSLADLYDGNTMPDLLRKAHIALDKAVLATFGLKPDATDEGILEVLFNLYSQATETLFSSPTPAKKRAKQ